MRVAQHEPGGNYSNTPAHHLGRRPVAKHYRTLLINDISRADRALGAWRDTGNNELAYDIHSTQALVDTLRSLVLAKTTFDAAVFSTHGNAGTIFFGKEAVQYRGLYSLMLDQHYYSRLFPSSNSRILFGGCNVAEGDDGWKFLLAAARCFLVYGGEAIGWTSAGFQAPFSLRHGHIVHLWGDTKQVRNMGGNSFRFYENWQLIESGGMPQAPQAVAASFAP
jgi:hypothetical protein